MILRVGIGEVGRRIGVHVARAAEVGLHVRIRDALAVVMAERHERVRDVARLRPGRIVVGMAVGDAAEILERLGSRTARRRRLPHTCGASFHCAATTPCSAAYSSCLIALSFCPSRSARVPERNASNGVIGAAGAANAVGGGSGRSSAGSAGAVDSTGTGARGRGSARSAGRMARTAATGARDRPRRTRNVDRTAVRGRRHHSLRRRSLHGRADVARRTRRPVERECLRRPEREAERSA